MAVTGPLTKQSQIRRLAAFLPVTLVRRLASGDVPIPGQARHIEAATLFADISGFTAMSEELATDGPRGAEELNRILLTTFTAMIDVIQAHGGAVSHFYGDAMAVYFPNRDGDAASRALNCSQVMQQLMQRTLGHVEANRPAGRKAHFSLTMKIGVGFGSCRELIVGHPERSLEFVLDGPAVEEAAAAEKQADAGQAVVSGSLLHHMGQVTSNRFTVYAAEPEEASWISSAPDWDNLSSDAWQRLGQLLPAFVPSTLVERHRAGTADNLGEHRPVTTLFVQFDFDSSESDSLQDDQLATSAAWLQAYYEWAVDLVDRYGPDNARVNRVLTADKGNQLHIIFGAPVAPDGPEQALRAALALRREKPAYIGRQRMGLVVGKVFAGPLGSVARQEYTVVGDIVNLSARLAQYCEADDILTDADTAARTDRWLQFEQLDHIQVKGKERFVVPYRVIDEKNQSLPMQSFVSRWQRTLVGRETEQQLLHDEMAQALAGSGAIVAIVGTTGTGKSHLLANTTRHWLENAGTGYLGVSYPHTSETPYGVWRAIWQNFFGLVVGQTPVEQAERVLQRTQELAPESGADAGLWAEILGLPIDQTKEVASLTAETRQARFFILARRCLLAQARQRPLCLLLEDLHWADHASLELLDELAGHLTNSPVFVALTFRPTETMALTVLERTICVPIVIADLSPQAARLLLSELAGTSQLPLAVEIRLGLRDRDGRDSPVNPLFLEEAVRMLQGAGILTGDGATHVNAARLSEVQLPDTIHGMLLARLDRLPAAERDLLQVASVIGRQFAARPLSVVSSETSRPLILQMLADLSEADMTQLVSADSDWIYLFQHAMTHDVAYRSLPYERRQRLHTLIAGWLLAEHAHNLRPHHALLAYHFDLARDAKNGLTYAFLAAEDARAAFANREAVELYTQGERHWQRLGGKARWSTAVDLFLGRANAYMATGDLDAAQSDSDTALRLAREIDARSATVEALNLSAEIAYRQGKLADIPDLTNIVLIDMVEDAGPLQQVRACLWAAWAACSQRNFGEALSYLKRAELLCHQEGDNFLQARVYEAESYAHYLQNDLEASLTAMQKAVHLSRAFSTPLNLGTALNNIGFVQYSLGMHDDAIETFVEAITIGYDSGENLLAAALANRGAALARTGQFERALADFEDAVRLLADMNYPTLTVEALLFWGFEYYVPREEWAPAREKLQAAKAIIDRQPATLVQENTRALLALGWVALNVGSGADARHYLDQAEELILKHDLVWWRPVSDYYCAKLALTEGRLQVARDALVAGAISIDNGGMPEFAPLILLAQAQLSQNESQRVKLLRDAVVAAQRRSRYQDRLVCYREAGPILAQQADSELRQLGNQCLAYVATHP